MKMEARRRVVGNPGRRLFLGSIVLAIALTGQVIGAAASGGAAATTPEQAFQVVPGDQPAIVVTGSGEASAPAEAAILQFVLAKDGAFAEGEATAGAEAPAPTGPPAMIEDDVAPVVEALVAAGVAETEIDVLINPFAGAFLGPSVTDLRVRLVDPEVDRLSEIATAGSDAAVESGLTLQFVGAGYVVADCAPLVRQAREAAIADARVQAEELAELLGVSVGDVVLATEVPYYGVAGGAPGCGEDSFSEGMSSGPGFPIFDPTLPAEVGIYSQLTVGFAIV
jgi:uncharacterized protein YggE